MKVTIEYNLPDDQHEHDCAIQSMQMYHALWDFSQELRSLYKHGDKDLDMVCQIRDRFHEILADYKVTLD